MSSACTYAATGRPLWLGCALCCPPPSCWLLPRCPSSASWYEHDLCDGGSGGEKNKGVSLITSTGHFKIHPTQDRNAGKEQVGGGGGVGWGRGGDEVDLDEGGSGASGGKQNRNQLSAL